MFIVEVSELYHPIKYRFKTLCLYLSCYNLLDKLLTQTLPGKKLH